MKIKLYFSFLLSLYSIVCLAQQDDTTTIAVNDTVPHFESNKRAPLWRPIAEVLLVQAIPFTFNNFSTTPNISKVSFKSIGDNFNLKNWEFDDDKFLTNQFAHPYHGNLYYNAFRSNGYSFWQSVPGTIAGSLVWETCGENNPASYNDMVNTSLGGIALGEMTYRVAGLIINRKRSGRRRTMQEILATLIDPINGFNRLVDGKWKEVSTYDPEDSLAVDITLDAGIRIVNKTSGQLFKNSRTELYGSFKMRYGDPFKDFKKPFDNFYVFMELGNADSAKLNSLWVQGSLWSKIVGGGDKSLKVLRLTMNYDFYKNTAFEYGGQSVLLTWLAKFNPGKNWAFKTELGGGAVILGASLDEHRVYKEARNYTYGSGLAIYTSGEVVYKNRLSYQFNFRSSWTGTISGSSSSKALHLANAELKYRFFKNFTISSSWGNYQLVGFYPGYTSTDDVFPYIRFSAGYKLVL